MKLRIGHLSTAYHTALLILGQKMLEKKGIKAEWKLFGGGPSIVEAMEKDEIDIGYIGLPPAMTGMARGAKIKCVSGGHVEGTILCTKGKADGTLKTVIRGLENKRIGCPPKGSIHDIIIRYLIKKYAVSSAIINYPWADFIPIEIERGTISAAVGTPALGAILKRDLSMDIAIPPEKLWPFNPSYGIISREEYLDTDVLRGFIEVHETACNIMIESPKKAAKTISKTLEVIDTDLALEIIKLSPHYCASLPREYIKSTMAFVPVMKELGYLSKTLRERDVFYTRIIEEVHGGKHHYNKPLMLY